MPIPNGLPYPVDMTYNAITQEFGENPESYTQFRLKGHNGLDIAPFNYGVKRLEVFCVDAGTVERAALDYTGWGNVIDVRHNWGMSRYAHLKANSLKVKVGDRVSRGQMLALMGNTGNVIPGPGNDGTHLHLGFYPSPPNASNGYAGAVDPKPFLVRSYVPPVTNPPPALGGAYKPEDLKAGSAKVIGTSGVAVRLTPNRISGLLVSYLPLNTPIVITDEFKCDGPVVYRKVEAWIAEYDGQTILIAKA